MQSRRAVLSAVGLGVAALAGCLSLEEDEPSEPGSQGGTDGSTEGEGGESESTDGSEDDRSVRALASLPAPVDGTDQLVAVTDTRFEGLRSAAGPLAEQPGPVGESARNFDEEVEGLSPSDLDRLTAQLALSEGEEINDVTAVARGSFDEEELRASLEEQIRSDLDEGQDLTTGSHREVEWLGNDAGEDPAVVVVHEATVAIRLVGGTDSAVADLAETTIDALLDDEVAHGDRVAGLVESYADETSLVVADVDPSLFEGENTPPGTDGLTAIGLGTTPTDGGGRSIRAVGRYENADQADADALETAVVEEFDGPLFEGGDPTDDVEFEADGRDVEIAGDLDGEDLTDDGLAVAAFPAVLFIGNIGGSEPPAPQVALSFERLDDGSVRVTHEGGDHVERLVVHYVADGEQRRAEWAPEEGVRAGDTFVTPDPVDDDTSVRVVWDAPNGDASAVLGEYTAA